MMKIAIESRISDRMQDLVTNQFKGLPYFEYYFDENSLNNQFSSLSKHGVVFVAYENETPIGFLSGYLIDSFFYNQKGIYTPEYGHYLPSDKKAKVLLFKALYEYMKEHGYTHHALSNVREEETSFLTDFAYACILKDGAIRTNNALQSTLQLQRVTEDTIEQYLAMCKEHEDYMASSPIFLGTGYNEREARAAINESGIEKFFLADHNQRYGFTTISHTDKAGSLLLKTRKSIAIKGTHILEQYQNQGIGKELVSALHQYASKNEYEYIVTDFESYNYKANLFWPKHFDIVMKSYVRYIG